MSEDLRINKSKWFQTEINFDYFIWPASREKGSSDIKDSVDPDQALNDIENTYT